MPTGVGSVRTCKRVVAGRSLETEPPPVWARRRSSNRFGPQECQWQRGRRGEPWWRGRSCEVGRRGRSGKPWWRGWAEKLGSEDGEANISGEVGRRGGVARTERRTVVARTELRGRAVRTPAERRTVVARTERRGGSEAAWRELRGMVAKSLRANTRERAGARARAAAINARVLARTCRCGRCGIDNDLSISFVTIVEAG